MNTNKTPQPPIYLPVGKHLVTIVAITTWSFPDKYIEETGKTIFGGEGNKITFKNSLGIASTYYYNPDVDVAYYRLLQRFIEAYQIPVTPNERYPDELYHIGYEDLLSALVDKEAIIEIAESPAGYLVITSIQPNVYNNETGKFVSVV